MEKFCQSCGMPMEDETLFGTENNGEKSSDYCKYCYSDGAFVANITMKEMVQVCVPFMVEKGLDKEQAVKMMEATLPTLKRWK
jgi:hypothetical protein